MSVVALLQDPKALGKRLREFVASKEDFEAGLAARSYAHGVMTAVIVGPKGIPPAEWMAEAASLTPEQAASEDAKLLKAMMLSEHDQIFKSLRSHSNYKPFFWEDSEGRLITKDWAYGFLAGVRLRSAAWKPLEEGNDQALIAVVFALLQNEEMNAGFAEKGGNPAELFEIAQTEISGLIQAQYSIRKEPDLDLGQSERKVGRNDPCPCGSGKKYKKCCLN
jgi:uncharacterized protein